MFAGSDPLTSRTEDRVLLAREEDEGSSNVKDLSVRDEGRVNVWEAREEGKQ